MLDAERERRVGVVMTAYHRNVSLCLHPRGNRSKRRVRLMTVAGWGVIVTAAILLWF
jgi:hypothetical protein